MRRVADGVPNNWVSVFRGSAWEWSERRQQFYYHAFTKVTPATRSWQWPHTGHL